MDSKWETMGKPDRSGKLWPSWARWLVSLLILFHISAVIAGAFAAQPSSKLERDAAELFEGYHQAIDQGDAYRYYSSAFPPTPVVTAKLTFADGQTREVRLPERGLRPRLLYQRQLALAHGLMEDYEAAQRDAGDGSRSRWAHSFATYLCQSNPGCKSVSLEVQMHLVPPLERIEHLLHRRDAEPVDLDSAEFYTDPRHIGVFPCDGS